MTSVQSSTLTRADYVIAGLLSLVTLLVSGFMAPRGFQFGFVDMAHDGYQLRQVMDLSAGGVLFRDTFDQYGILSAYVNAAGFRLFGSTLLGLKYFLCLVYAVTAVFTYLVGRELTNRWLAAFSVLLWLAIAPFYQHGIMVSAHVHILLMQALALYLMLRMLAGRARPLPVAAVVGVLTALMWAAKATSGFLFAACVIACIVGYGRSVTRSPAWTARMLAAFALPGLGVVAMLLGVLFAAGALGDWRLQTMEFPRRFYLRYMLEVTGSTGTLGGSLSTFMWRNLDVEFMWLALRGGVMVGALVAAFRLTARESAPVVLMAVYTLLASGSAFPSANFMHQSWTASLAVPALVAVMERSGRAVIPSRAVAQLVAVVIVGMVASQPVLAMPEPWPSVLMNSPRRSPRLRCSPAFAPRQPRRRRSRRSTNGSPSIGSASPALACC